MRHAIMAKKPQSPRNPRNLPARSNASAPLPTASGSQPAAALLSKYAPVRQVILPALNLKEGEPRVLYIGDAMRVSTVKTKPGKPVKDEDGQPIKEKPATVCTATDMETGEQFTLLVPAVMEGNLRECYPDDSYIGKAFLCEKKPKRPGKRYFDFSLIEVAISAAS